MVGSTTQPVIRPDQLRQNSNASLEKDRNNLLISDLDLDRTDNLDAPPIPPPRRAASGQPPTQPPRALEQDNPQPSCRFFFINYELIIMFSQMNMNQSINAVCSINKSISLDFQASSNLLLCNIIIYIKHIRLFKCRLPIPQFYGSYGT